ncbi:MAG TPA: glycosyltransferase [Terriglobales bacterium]|nr:glycosyltransferase [Terriglobales bacterium]
MLNEANPRCEVAVIIPSYNAASCLPRALDSVFAQTYRDYRIYVIDDGSTDDTEAVLRPYASRVVCVHQTHAGQASARNQGIRLSNSPYVAFLDADDEWLPNKLERLIEVLRRDSRIGLVYSDCSTSGTGPSSGSRFASVGIPAGGRVFTQLLDNCNVFTPTVVVRRECLEDVGLFTESLPVGEDLNLWLRIAARWEVAVVPEVLAIRHSRPGGLSLTTSVDRKLSSGIALIEHVIQTCTHLRAHERHALRKSIANRHYEYGSYLLRNGDRGPCRHQMCQAIRRGRLDWRVLTKVAFSFLPYRVFASLREIRQSLGRLDSKKRAPAVEQSGSNCISVT